jgi:DNA primase
VLQEAANLAGMAQPPAPIARESELEAPAVTDETYDRIAAALLNGCSPMRSASPHAAAYLDRRGVFADAEAVGVRGLPRDGQELSTTLLGTFERGNLESASVLRRGYDTLNWPAWELVIPWRDRYGRIVCLQRRHLGDVRPKYRFPFGRAPRAPFGVDLLADALGFHGPEAAVVIVEGALDCLARRRIARHQGERLAVLGIASAGTPAVGLPLDLLAGRCVVLALDRDEAGTRARDELAKVLADVASELRVAA